MLSAMRQGSDNIFVKMFLGVVILGFIATGGLVSYSAVQSNNYVVTVGEANVTTNRLYNLFANEVNRISRSLGFDLQPAFLKLIEQQTVNRLLAEATLENKAKQLNLAISDERVNEVIKQDRNFAGSDGNFDRAIFEGILRQNGLNEKTYIEMVKQQELIGQLTRGVATINTSPEIFTSIINDFNNEKRSAQYFTIAEKDVTIKDAPDDATLETFYNGVKSQFDIPAYRKAELITIDPAKLAEGLEVAEDVLTERFEEIKDSYQAPEKRAISKIIYDNQADADAAYKAHTEEGKSFEDLAAVKGLTAGSEKLGEFAKADLPNQKMAEVAFLLQKDQVSTPIDTGFGFELVKVTDIVPAVVKTFADVRDEILKGEQLRLAQDQVFDLRDQVEDEIAGGATFAEIAEKFKMDLAMIDAIDENARDKNDQQVQLPQAVGLTQKLFEAEIDLDSDPLDTQNGGLTWYKVTEITPSTNAPLADVKEDVLKLWRVTEVKAALIKLAEELVAKAGDINELASGYSDEIQISAELKRNVQNANLTNDAINKIFATKKDGYTFAETQIDGQPAYQILQVSDIIAASNEDMDALNAQIAASIAPEIAESLIDGYVKNYTSFYGSSINQNLIDQVTNNRTAQ